MIRYCLMLVGQWFGFLPAPMYIEALDASLRFHKRRHSALPPVEDSEVSSVRRMQLSTMEPGRYVGLGKKVIKDRRLRNEPLPPGVKDRRKS